MQPTVVKKDEAKAVIDKAAEAKKAEIDQTPNATDERKGSKSQSCSKCQECDRPNNKQRRSGRKREWSRINQCANRIVKKDQAKAEIDNVAKLRKQKSIETQMRQKKKK